MDERYNGAGPKQRINLEMGAADSGAALIRPVRNPASYAGFGPHRFPVGGRGDDGPRLDSGFRTTPPKRETRGMRLMVFSALTVTWLVVMGLLTLIAGLGGWSIP
jgi:hypothetical protein